MTPTAIIDKIRALKDEMTKATEAAQEGNLLRAQKVLEDVQRANAAVLRLLEMQINGVGGIRRTAPRPPRITGERAGISATEPVKGNR
jgi:hypothetical protein